MNILDFYKENNKPIKLNLGCRNKPLPGYVNIDIVDNPNADLIDNALILKTIEDNTVDLIEAVHMVEHIPMVDFKQALRVWKRKLKEGGTLRLSVPDFDKCIGLYKLVGYDTIKTMLYGSQRNEFDFHREIYNRENMVFILQGEGFHDIKDWNYWEVFPHNYVDTYAGAVWPPMHKKFLCDNGKLEDFGGVQLSLNIECKK